MNSTVLNTLICMAIGYLVGCFNPSYLLAKRQGFDIREHGSGNAGATNVIITIGKKVGFLVALFDIAKAYFVVRLACFLFPELSYAAECAGVFVILGHIFPFTMGFRGGKGLACLGGVILAFHSGVFALLLLAEIILAYILDYICVVPITASAVFPIIYYLMTGKTPGAMLYAALIPLFVYKHLENLKRIQLGTEARFSYLWRKDDEVKHLTEEARKH